MYKEAFDKTLLIVILFAVFVVLANVWHFKTRRTAAARRLARHRRRLRREGGAEAEEVPEPEIPPQPFWAKWSPALSIVALLLCIASLFLMWYMATVGLIHG